MERLEVDGRPPHDPAGRRARPQRDPPRVWPRDERLALHRPFDRRGLLGLGPGAAGLPARRIFPPRQSTTAPSRSSSATPRSSCNYSTLGPTGQFGTFKQLSTTKFDSDPFAWQSPAGGVELFAVDEAGHLQASYHYPTRWASWATLASGVDACPVPLLTPQCPNGDGYYCGGHGVGGTKGTLYSCTGGALSLENPCPNGCEDIGKGGNDQCGCNSNADCAQCGVCLQQALMCVSGSGVTGNNCTAYLDNALGMSCNKDSDCDPCGASDGGVVCASCASLPTNTCAGSCCQFGG